MIGIDLHSQDGQMIPPTITKLDPDALFTWFRTDSNTEMVPIRILCVQVDKHSSTKDFEVTVPDDVVAHLMWNTDV